MYVVLDFCEAHHKRVEIREHTTSYGDGPLDPPKVP